MIWMYGLCLIQDWFIYGNLDIWHVRFGRFLASVLTKICFSAFERIFKYSGIICIVLYCEESLAVISWTHFVYRWVFRLWPVVACYSLLAMCCIVVCTWFALDSVCLTYAVECLAFWKSNIYISLMQCWYIWFNVCICALVGLC